MACMKTMVHRALCALCAVERSDAKSQPKGFRVIGNKNTRFLLQHELFQWFKQFDSVYKSTRLPFDIHRADRAQHFIHRLLFINQLIEFSGLRTYTHTLSVCMFSMLLHAFSAGFCKLISFRFHLLPPIVHHLLPLSLPLYDQTFNGSCKMHDMFHLFQFIHQKSNVHTKHRIKVHKR